MKPLKQELTDNVSSFEQLLLPVLNLDYYTFGIRNYVMISPKEAKQILIKKRPTSKKQMVALISGLNHVLAEDIYSPINMPPFRQSAMDGYALNLHDFLSYKLIGEVKAGDAHQLDLKPGEAVKIFTGAAVPDSANTVVQIEKTSFVDGTVLLSESFALNKNIRPIGEQIKTDDLALEKGTLLNAAAIGFLAGLGLTDVTVYKKPTVGILVTGNELVKPGNKLASGKIYESNSVMLQAALLSADFTSFHTYSVDDNFINTKKIIAKATEENDVLLISGGISVGDYDFVKSALDELKVETLFYKVNQKPGKPLLVGKIKDKLIFALPGNPAASLTCYYIYVEPILHQISGKYNGDFIVQKALSHDFEVNNSRSQFLKASFCEGEVAILTHQQSSMLNTFAFANCLVYLPEGNYKLKKGEKVDVHPIC
ncbi:MAG TPA: gephyrin-like molybdotransferase Glp [Pelobium sp.]